MHASAFQHPRRMLASGRRSRRDQALAGCVQVVGRWAWAAGLTRRLELIVAVVPVRDTHNQCEVVMVDERHCRACFLITDP